MLGTVFYLTLLDTAQLETVEVQTGYQIILRSIHNPLVRVRSVWLATSMRRPLLGTPYQYTVEIFIYFFSFQTSSFDKVCHNNVDTGCLHSHYASVKYVTV